MDKRIRAVVTINPRQKGFISEPGCFANVQILHEAVNQMKNDTGGVGVILDISKAFDTVPHKTIKWALSRKGMPEPLINMIESYTQVRTSIQHPSKNIEIQIKRGVKQGDPLSPLIFNLVMESLLEKLDNMTGYELLNKKISVLAFADDLVLLAKDASQAQDLVDVVTEYLGALGMSLSVPKCATFQISKSGQTWYIKDPNLERMGQKIPMIKNDHTLMYLGGVYSVWDGFPSKSTISNLLEAVDRLQKAHLKPMQILHLL